MIQVMPTSCINPNTDTNAGIFVTDRSFALHPYLLMTNLYLSATTWIPAIILEFTVCFCPENHVYINIFAPLGRHYPTFIFPTHWIPIRSFPAADVIKHLCWWHQRAALQHTAWDVDGLQLYIIYKILPASWAALSCILQYKLTAFKRGHSYGFTQQNNFRNQDYSLAPDVKIRDAFCLAAVFDIYEDCCSMF